MDSRRVGLFGGTFDPPHLGHVAALRAAVLSGRFRCVEVTVAGDPYQKGRRVTPAPLRLAMAEAAFAGLEHVRVSNREILRPGPSYTVDTVREILDEDGVDAVDLVIGADLVAQLDEWREADALRELVAVGVVPRPGARHELPRGWRAYEIDMSPVDLSSSFIREYLIDGSDLSRYLPSAVIPLYEESRG